MAGGDNGVVVVVVVDDEDQSLNSWHYWNDLVVSIVTRYSHSHSDLVVVAELVIATNLVVVVMLSFVMLYWNHNDVAVSVRVVYLHWLYYHTNSGCSDYHHQYFAIMPHTCPVLPRSYDP